MDAKHEYSAQKLLCCNLRCTDQRLLFQDMFVDLDDEARYLDWAKVNGMYKFISDTGFWVNFLSKYVNVVTPPNLDQLLSTKLRLVRTLMDLMNKNDLSCGWDTTIKTLILINIERVQGLYTVDLFLGKILHKNVQNNCMRMMSLMADSRFTPEEYTSTMTWVIRQGISIDKEALWGDIDDAIKQSMESRDTIMMKTMQTSHGRLRLRERLSFAMKKQTSASINRDTFTGFQSRLNFSSNVSSHTQLKAYMVMAQTSIEKDQALQRLLPESMSTVVAKEEILEPDPSIIMDVISRMTYTRSPFAKLSEFHSKCFNSIAFSHKHSLTLSDIMQLYVSAYQNKAIWQKCWTNVLPVMNAQLVRDVENFVSSNPSMDAAAFIYCLSGIT